MLEIDRSRFSGSGTIGNSVRALYLGSWAGDLTHNLYEAHLALSALLLRGQAPAALATGLHAHWAKLSKRYFELAVLLFLCPVWAADPGRWVPARWDGGSLELALLAKGKALPADAHKAIARWYEPTTLGLLESTPINCLLVTFSIGARPEVLSCSRPLR